MFRYYLAILIPMLCTVISQSTFGTSETRTTTILKTTQTTATTTPAPTTPDSTPEVKSNTTTITPFSTSTETSAHAQETTFTKTSTPNITSRTNTSSIAAPMIETEIDLPTESANTAATLISTPSSTTTIISNATTTTRTTSAISDVTSEILSSSTNEKPQTTITIAETTTPTTMAPNIATTSNLKIDTSNAIITTYAATAAMPSSALPSLTAISNAEFDLTSETLSSSATSIPLTTVRITSEAPTSMNPGTNIPETTAEETTIAQTTTPTTMAPNIATSYLKNETSNAIITTHAATATIPSSAPPSLAAISTAESDSTSETLSSSTTSIPLTTIRITSAAPTSMNPETNIPETTAEETTIAQTTTPTTMAQNRATTSILKNETLNPIITTYAATAAMPSSALPSLAAISIAESDLTSETLSSSTTSISLTTIRITSAAPTSINPETNIPETTAEETTIAQTTTPATMDSNIATASILKNETLNPSILTTYAATAAMTSSDLPSIAAISTAESDLTSEMLYSSTTRIPVISNTTITSTTITTTATSDLASLMLSSSTTNMPQTTTYITNITNETTASNMTNTPLTSVQDTTPIWMSPTLTTTPTMLESSNGSTIMSTPATSPILTTTTSPPTLTTVLFSSQLSSETTTLIHTNTITSTTTSSTASTPDSTTAATTTTITTNMNVTTPTITTTPAKTTPTSPLSRDGCESQEMDIGVSHYVRFPSTSFGQRIGSLQQCLPPAGRNPVAKGQCIGNFTTGGSWIIVYVDPCTNDTIANDSSSAVTQDLLTLSKESINTNNVNNRTSQLSNLTTDSSILRPVDIILVANILDNVAYVKKIPTSAGENFVSVMNNVMNVNDSTLNDSQQQLRIIQALETMTSNVDLTGVSNFSSFSTNLAVQVWNMSNTDSNNTTGKIQVVGFGYQNETNSYSTYFRRDVGNSSFDTAIILSQEAIDEGEKYVDQRNNTDGLRASFIIYQKTNLFPQTSDSLSNNEHTNSSNQTSVNSHVVSGLLNGIPIANLTDPVRIYLRSTQKNFSSPTCAYLGDQGENNTRGWSGDGLLTNYSNYTDSLVVCYSTHLTNFAVLAGSDVAQNTPIGRALEIISIIGLSLSIVGLTLTILAQILFRKIRKGRSQMVLLHLALASLAVDIIVLADVRPNQTTYVGCCAVAALLHYFLLVSFLWMLVEAVIQYLKFVKVFDTYTPRFMLKAALPAWLIPAVIVGIVAAVDYDLFRGSEHYCWLAPKAFHYAFLFPLGLIMVTNLVLFILVIKGITCDRAKGLQSNQSKSKIVWLQVQAAIACFVLMGLTWLFAFFAIDGAALPMQFLFCIFNSIQGFFIFIFLSIRERPVRRAWMHLFGLIVSKSLETLPKRNNNRIPSKNGSIDQNKQESEIESSGFDTSHNYCQVESTEDGLVTER